MFQKSRSKWLEFGDRNTRYFHGVATIRRRRNHVKSIQNEHGVWLEDSEELETNATRYFQELFASQGNHSAEQIQMMKSITSLKALVPLKLLAQMDSKSFFSKVNGSSLAHPFVS